jgi:hypothetical protein
LWLPITDIPIYREILHLHLFPCIVYLRIAQIRAILHDVVQIRSQALILVDSLLCLGGTGDNERYLYPLSQRWYPDGLEHFGCGYWYSSWEWAPNGSHQWSSAFSVVDCGLIGRVQAFWIACLYPPGVSIPCADSNVSLSLSVHPKSLSVGNFGLHRGVLSLRLGCAVVLSTRADIICHVYLLLPTNKVYSLIVDRASLFQCKKGLVKNNQV